LSPRHFRGPKVQSNVGELGRKVLNYKKGDEAGTGKKIQMSKNIYKVGVCVARRCKASPEGSPERVNNHGLLGPAGGSQKTHK